jgi:MarR family transcriptional regulator for hemolysin
MFSIIDNIYASKGLYQELLGPVCKKYNLTDSEVVILLFLAGNDGDTATDIVLRQRLKKSVVSVSLKDLLDRGLISSTYLDGNRKSAHLKVTEKAEEIIAEAKKVQDDYYKLLTEGLSKDEKNNLSSYLKIVNDNIKSYRK